MTRHAHRDAANLLHLLDLDVAVAEDQKLGAGVLGGRENIADQNAFREALVIVEGAIHAAVEILVDIEEPGLFLHVNFVGAAGQIHLHATLLQGFEQPPRSRHQVFLRGNMAGAQLFDTVPDARPEKIEVDLLVDEGFERPAAAFLDGFGESDHLVDRFLARQLPDELFDYRPKLIFGFTALQVSEDFDHHGHHNVHPTGADERQGAVEIEEHNAGIAGGRTRRDVFHHLFPLYGLRSC